VIVSYCDIQGGYPGTGNFSHDPLFLNPAAGDFRIRSSSPLVDTGTTVDDPVLDIRDLARPQGTDYDIGIYEFLDSDGDGMEDPWETLYGLNPNDPSDAAGDLDSDGFTNLEEFELDTDPTTPTVVPATYYVSLEGDDDTGDGTAENPWRTIAFAMNEAGLVAPYIGGATVHLAAGVYEEPVALMPHVTLMGDAATTTTIRYFNAADDDHVVIRGADESALKQVKVTLPSLHADVTVLVRIDDVATEIADCMLDGGDNLFSIGVLVSGVGSSDSTIHDNTIRRVQYGIQAVNSAVNITENVFEAIRGDAVFVELPAKKQAGEALTPLLGDAENDDSGFNEFKNVAGRFVLNLSENKTAAEYNDWGVYSAAQIAAKVSGDVDFMPFLGRDGTIPVGPGAAFTTTPVEGTAPLVVEFDDASDAGSFDITSWSWDFGDPESGVNNVSAAQNPTHTYTQPGRYTVVLTVETGAGSDSLTQVDLVEVTAAEGPQASFSVAPGQGYAPLLVQFNDTSTAGTATVTGWDWDFGDPLSGAANTSAEQNPSHTYANTGIYYVKLTIETSMGEDTAFRSAVVVEAPEAPVASFTADPLTGSAPLDVQFTDASDLGTGTGATWEWNFDDPDSGESNVSTEQNPVHTFAAPGLYTVTLTVTTDHGTDEHTELAYINVTRRGCGADGKLEFASAGVFLLVFERVTRRRRYHA
jgi:PKD repeat protein